MLSLSLTADIMCNTKKKSCNNTISVYIFQYLCSTFRDNRQSVGLSEQFYIVCEGGFKERAENLFSHWNPLVGCDSSLQLDKLKRFHLEKKKLKQIKPDVSSNQQSRENTHRREQQQLCLPHLDRRIEQAVKKKSQYFSCLYMNLELRMVKLCGRCFVSV